MSDDIKELHGLLAKLFNPNNYTKTKEKEKDYQELLQMFMSPEKIADQKKLCAQLVFNVLFYFISHFLSSFSSFLHTAHNPFASYIEIER